MKAPNEAKKVGFNTAFKGFLL